MKAFSRFVSNDYPTVGVEQELHLIDPVTGQLSARMEDVWANVDQRLDEFICHELVLSVLEVRSRVCRTIDELLVDVIDGRSGVARACKKVGVLMAAAGSHSFADWKYQPFVDSEHYHWVHSEHGIIAKRLMAFGLHVHVGVRSGDCAVYVINELRRWTFPLLAMSANSPYFEGMRTGLASTRYHLMGSMPRTGLPPAVKRLVEIEKLFHKLKAAGDVTAPGDLWWAIRPQPPFGTVELRILDLPTDVRRLAALAAVTQAAVAVYQDRYEQNVAPSPLRDEYLEENRWKAMRHGLDCDIIEPQSGEVISMRDQLGRLLDIVERKAEELGSAKHLAFARQMLVDETEADRQVRFCQENDNDLRALEMNIAQRSLEF